MGFFVAAHPVSYPIDLAFIRNQCHKTLLKTWKNKKARILLFCTVSFKCLKTEKKDCNQFRKCAYLLLFLRRTLIITNKVTTYRARGFQHGHAVFQHLQRGESTRGAWQDMGGL